MPSSPQSIAPPPWNESAAFRETTLRLFPNPADRSALQRVGEMLHDMALETSGYGPDPESSTRTEMRAVAADLRHLEGYLAMVRRSADARQTTRSPGSLASRLPRWGCSPT
jgi:hypothetical protein